MKQIDRTLNASNIDDALSIFSSTLASVGQSILGKVGVPLFAALKREKLLHGPYRGVSLFEAANRIMSDLVILNGVAGLLKRNDLPFSSYTVELGNENKNGFDIRASEGKVDLIGEAFNVAPSFFQTKKLSALRKMRKEGVSATYKILMFNNDAVSANYHPKSQAGLYHILVDIESGQTRVMPSAFTAHSIRGSQASPEP